MKQHGTLGELKRNKPINRNTSKPGTTNMYSRNILKTSIISFAIPFSVTSLLALPTMFEVYRWYLPLQDGMLVEAAVEANVGSQVRHSCMVNLANRSGVMLSGRNILLWLRSFRLLSEYETMLELRGFTVAIQVVVCVVPTVTAKTHRTCATKKEIALKEIVHLC